VQKLIFENVEEENILAGDKVMKYLLKPNRFFDNSLADLHFRTAESQVWTFGVIVLSLLIH
jgi:hypothetical protein